MLHIKSIRNASVTHVWQMLSKSVTFSFEIFTRCEKFVRILHTCDKYEWEKYGSTALSCGQWRPMYMLIRIIAGHMCYGLAHTCMRAVIQFYWFLAFQLFIEIKSNKVICFEIKCLRLYTAKEVIIQAKSNERFAGQWILGTWRQSYKTKAVTKE